MIEFIRGELYFKGANYLIVLIGGIAYRVNASSITIAKLPAVGEEVTVFIHLHVREDELALFGFFSLEEREMFNALMQVSGIGPKLAMAILSQLSVRELRQAILFGDIQPLVSISGVGKKTAGRILLELKDKIGKDLLPEEIVPESATAVSTDLRSEAVSALLALGYSLSEAQKAIPIVQPGDNTSVEELIRIALKKMSKL